MAREFNSYGTGFSPQRINVLDQTQAVYTRGSHRLARVLMTWSWNPPPPQCLRGRWKVKSPTPSIPMTFFHTLGSPLFYALTALTPNFFFNSLSDRATSLPWHALTVTSKYCDHKYEYIFFSLADSAQRLWQGTSCLLLLLHLFVSWHICCLEERADLTAQQANKLLRGTIVSRTKYC